MSSISHISRGRSFVWFFLLCLVGPTLFAAEGQGSSSRSNDVYSAHVAKLPKREGFTIVVEPPFVVVGDEASETVRRRAATTVRWAVERLKKEYFSRDPTGIIDIWLFRDHQSYTNHAWTLFNDRPETPFGYFSEKNHALVMNIATGGGTLVHEMVHAFMQPNFPGCPAWFNEGLASLYEASKERDGRIIGLVNWRFKGLEKAIQTGRTISFKELTSKSDSEFYSGDSYNQFYAQARYLCFYLQEKGLLQEFFREFMKSSAMDPTGFETLVRVLGEPDMKTFQAKWEKFVLDLR